MKMNRTKNVSMLMMVLAATAFTSPLFTACSKSNTLEEGTAPTKEQNVSGKVSGVWTQGSIIYVDGSIIIPKGESLTIEPGVVVIMNAQTMPEILIEGNFYSMGTKESPVLFTVAEKHHTTANQFGGLWGGLLAAPSSAEILLDHTILEYGGAETTEASPSVLGQYYKKKAGERIPALWTSNVKAKVVVNNCTIRHFSDDAFYLEGGNTIITNSIFHTTGIAGGEAINTKSGVVADVAFNVIYSPNTNALKLSNAGDRSPQGYVKAYNNTILNAGWRRPTSKGGSIWVEKEIRAEIQNNLLVNSRYGIKQDSPTGPDSRNIYSHNYYYGYTQQGVDQFQAKESGVIIGQNEVRGTLAGQNDPMFVNYPLATAGESTAFDKSWNLHLKAGSPALGKGKTGIIRNFPTGISIKGKTYTAPESASFIGAFGV